MHKPKLNEHQLADLLDCLYEKFTSLHGSNTSQLNEHSFSVTDRMSCSKSARLNFMYPATGHDGQRVQMHNSVYVEAVKTLAQRRLVQWTPNNPLAFSLTLHGYEQAHSQRTKPDLSRWESLSNLLNAHTGIIGVLAIVIGGIVTWVFAN